MARCTNNLDAAVHISPESKKIPHAAVSAAASRSGASAKTMFGDLPPSSSHTRLRLESAEYRRTSRPTSVDPVKVTTSTPVQPEGAAGRRAGTVHDGEHARRQSRLRCEFRK
ncbi:hypothetical protein BCF44_105489 [Kutzneria buriramensis]|uniref:Uncharacterized protein n=1 Tax=Kutzneria buriramensis TaxID=1045776 RepID=A0A3E0HQT1_9PSEU|nr:hypothetical protein [Kutzneria buriramensis]REH48630.1 hypothetical protein BCF44_105489 [Kutzneria buriramensis]